MAAPIPELDPPIPDPAPVVGMALIIPPGLNGKQFRFALHFREHRNKTRAAREAGYSAKTAHAIGFELLRKPEIIALIARLDAAHLESLYCSINRVLAELVAVGLSDMRNYLVFDPDTGMPTVNFDSMPLEASRAIQEFQQEEFVRGKGADQVTVTRTRIKLHSKGGALAELVKLMQAPAGTAFAFRNAAPGSAPIPGEAPPLGIPSRAASLADLEARFVAIHEREQQAQRLLGVTTEPRP